VAGVYLMSYHCRIGLPKFSNSLNTGRSFEI
jgi:hypothetical protein